MGLKVNRDSLRLTTRVRQLAVPLTLDVPGKSFKIMKDILSPDQIKIFEKSSKYDLREHKGGSSLDYRAPAFIKNPMKGDAPSYLVFLSLLDGRAYANWLNKLTGRKFRVPKEYEWITAIESVGNHLRSSCYGSYWEWTESSTNSSGSTYFILRKFTNNKLEINWPAFDDKITTLAMPDERGNCFAIRLIEDITPTIKNLTT